MCLVCPSPWIRVCLAIPFSLHHASCYWMLPLNVACPRKIPSTQKLALVGWSVILLPLASSRLVTIFQKEPHLRHSKIHPQLPSRVLCLLQLKSVRIEWRGRLAPFKPCPFSSGKISGCVRISETLNKNQPEFICFLSIIFSNIIYSILKSWHSIVKQPANKDSFHSDRI